ncbi:uncharacterized protein [Spinacia oleracea]|uniref:DUF4283 domain-containing protein n=1 Tax=Spinacia oleracea TaxID=3562 RepID=A0ABM3R2Y5_SPIOL|nr:uncharacterized protein LOC130464747 [Spinacia oleracea]
MDVPVLNNEHDPEIVQIELEDIQEEISYWESAILCYVLGANPPQNVMEGFVRRIWGKLGVDKVALVGRGMFLVRFTTMENCQKVINGGFQFFDGKPVILKPWNADMDISKDPVKKLPIWIQLPNLEVKYWGEKSLSKIVSQIGTMIKVDQATHNRDKLMFAKVLVEVNIDQQFPEVIRFRSEIGRMIEQRVIYDWLPISCSICKGMGHTSNACTRRAALATQRVWRPKAIQPVAHLVAQPVTHPMTQPVSVCETQTMIDTTPRGITQAARFSKQKNQQLKPVYTANKYQLLSEVDVEYDNGEIPNGEENQFQRSPVGRGVAAPKPNG